MDIKKSKILFVSMSIGDHARRDCVFHLMQVVAAAFGAQKNNFYITFFCECPTQSTLRRAVAVELLD